MQVTHEDRQRTSTSEMNRQLAALAVFVIIAAFGAPHADAAVDGGAVYAEHCLACHGERGDGNTRLRRGVTTPPRDFTSAAARRELDRARMIRSVAAGRPGTAMPGYADKLSQDEIAAVVDHIRATYMSGMPEQEARPARIVLGEQLYVRNCAVCHGDKGSGAMWTQSSLNPSPRDFTAPAAREELSRERMIASVTHGRPGTAMMSFQKRLSADEIETVVDYIRASFFMKGPAPAAPAAPHPAIVQADMSLPFAGGLVGDAGKGKEFYEHNCYTCHGLAGDGAGPRAKFISPRPRNFLAPESRLRLNRPALFTAVHDGLRGTVMPAWGHVLSDQEIADVAEYVFTAFVRAQPVASAGGAAVKKKLNAP